MKKSAASQAPPGGSEAWGLAQFEKGAPVLEAVVADPSGGVRHPPQLGGTERRRIVVEWNDTRVDYPKDALLHRLFEGQVERTPDAVAVSFEKESLTYRELDKRANQLAHYLRSKGVDADSPVGICMERSIEMVTGLLGILKAGGAYVPLDPGYPAERLAFMMAEARMSVVVAQQRLLGRLPAHTAEVVCLDSDWTVVAREPAERPAVTMTARNLAYVIYTSGSTGKPKGAMNTHAGICNRLLWGQDAYNLTPADRVLQKTPFSFDVSVWEFFWPLVAGARLVMARPGGQRDSGYLIDTIVKEGITVIHFVPPMLAVFLADEDAGKCRSLSRVFCSGDALSFDLQERFFSVLPARLHNLYGPTEAAVEVTGWDCQRGGLKGVVPIGRPIANTQIYLLDESLEPVPVGVAGELHIGGVSLARGYWGRPDLTAEKFIPDPFSDDPDARLYKTGDLAKFLPDGNIVFLGRIDHQVKLRGFRIELGEIETALRGAPGVREAVVVLRDAPPEGKALVAYVTTGAGAAEDESALRATLMARLPEYMVPSRIEFLSRLPLTANGKVDRGALPVPGRRISTRPYVRPRNAVEEMLVGIWAEVLRVERVGAMDNFFDLGGHSLLAMQVISRVRRLLEVDAPVRMLYEAPTPADFANALPACKGRAAWPLASWIPKRSGMEPAPLSFAQGRLWLLDRLAPGLPAYNEPSFWQIDGPLDAEALRAALGEIVRRHEALRTVFREEGGTPMQVISPARALPMPVTDLRRLADPDAETERLANEEAERPFDLANGPLFRARLLCLGETRHVLLIVMHHIICDGWSMGVLFRELGALYSAFSAGKLSPLPELPIQYPDFSLWQRGWLEGDALDRQLAWWQGALRGNVPTLELPADHPRPGVFTYRGARREFALPGSLGRALTALGREENASLFMTLLAAFQALLSRYTGQEEFLLGTPVANRNRAETEGLIGFFVNTLALRADLAGEPTFRELLGRVRETVWGALEHQDLPFEKLVEQILPGRDPSRHPLFQVMFVFQNAHADTLELPGARVEALKAGGSTSKFDLTLSMAERADGSLEGTIEYSTDLFEPATIERMTGHFQTLLDGIVARPEARLGELPMLTGAERRALVEWNGTETDYPREATIHEVFERQVERAPEATALIFQDRQVSYRELNRRANRFADRLRKLGAGRGSLVAIRMERSIEMVVGILGVLKAGGAYLPIEMSDPAARWHSLVESGGARFLVGRGSPDGGVPKGVERLEVEDGPEGEDDSNPDCIGGALEPACVFFTSGSTGAPKGVAVPHRAVLRLLLGVDYVKLGPEETLLQMAPASFDAATFELWGALLHGGRCVLFPGSVPTVATLGETLRRHDVTTLWLTSSLFNLVIDEAPEILANVRQLLAGGEALSVRHVRKALEVLPRPRFINGYGPTEGTTFTCCHTVREAPGESARSIPIGRPIANTRVHVLDDRLNALPVGVPGELFIGGDGLALGYWNLPALTTEKFIADPFAAEPGARLYRTGDLARRLPDGTIEFLGRLDGQVKIRGYRIEPGEIQTALEAHPGVRESAVIAREDSAGSKYLAAYVAPRDGAEPEISTLRAFLESRLPNWMIPSVFVTLKALPLSPNGKVDRKALAALAPEYAEPGNRYAAPSTPSEKMIAEIWREMLGCERIGVDDHFFEFGGHSLLAVRMLARLEAAAGKKVPLATLFAHPTIRALAREIGGKEVARTLSVLPVRKEGTKPPFFFFYGDVMLGPGFCFELGKHLGEDQPLYVVTPPDLHGPAAHSSLEATAKALMESVREVQAGGPYVLGGYCYGGLVAYEAARQLEAGGERVEAVILLDSLPPKRRIFHGTRRFVERAGASAGVNRDWQLRVFMILLDFQLRYDGWLRLRGREKVTRFPRRFARWLSGFPRHLKLSGEGRKKSGPAAGSARSGGASGAFVGELAAWELAGYSTRPYPGRVALFMSQDAPVHKNDPAYGWSEFVPSVEVHQIPGDHGGCVTTHRHVLFEKLRICLERTSV